VAVRTLITGGFVLDSIHRNPGYAVLSMVRPDEFGRIQRYCFAIAEGVIASVHVEGARIIAGHEQATLVLVGPTALGEPAIPWRRFMNLFGGPVLDSTPLEPDFSARIVELGHNRLPEGLEGEADDLFELYVRAALQFVLGTRVIRYGQSRLFEARPDGISLPEQGFTALFDAKAYADGYEVTLTTLRQLRDYVDEFTRRYNAFLPRLNTCMLVSGSFRQGEDALTDKSRDLFAQCGVPITFITAEALAQVVALLAEYPAARKSLKWSRVFADPILRVRKVQAEIGTVLRDSILPAKHGGGHGNID
jgi:hypothetical protein